VPNKPHLPGVDLHVRDCDCFRQCYGNPSIRVVIGNGWKSIFNHAIESGFNRAWRYYILRAANRTIKNICLIWNWKRHLSDIWVTFEWHLSDIWVTFEWHLSDFWVTFLWKIKKYWLILHVTKTIVPSSQNHWPLTFDIPRKIFPSEKFFWYPNLSKRLWVQLVFGKTRLACGFSAWHFPWNFI